MTRPTQVTVIIPNLHSPVIGRVLAALRAQTAGLADCEVMVIGQDHHQLVQTDEVVTFVRTPYPVAAAVARNLGLQQARGSLLAFLDSDCIPAPDWLAHIRAYFENPDHHVLVGAVDFPANDYWTLSDNLSTFYGWVPSARPGPQLYAPTLNLAVRRGVVDRVGLLDEGFPGAAGEDIDWTLRMRRAGYVLHFAPDMIITHCPQRNTPEQLLQRAYGFGYNMVKVRTRYPDQIMTPFYHRDPFWLVALAPLMALGITLKIFAQNSALWKYWYTAPAIYAAKVVSRLGGAKRPL